MQKKITICVLVFQLIFLLTACEYDIIETVKIPDSPDGEGISFSESIIPIFTANCVSCHNGSVSPDLRAENAFNSLISGDYIDAVDSELSSIYTKLQGGSHESRASAVEKQLILTWITQGAQNN